MLIGNTKALVDGGIDPKFRPLPQPQTGVERHVKSLTSLATAGKTLGALKSTYFCFG
jgi:hypothetical protein